MTNTKYTGMTAFAQRLMSRAVRNLVDDRYPVGQVTSIKEGVIHLWVSHPSALASLTLRVSVNGRLLNTTRIPRVDLRRAGKPLVLTIPTSMNERLTAGDVVTVTMGRSRHLGGSPWHVADTLPDLRWALIHIPKTAGTSLRMAIERAIGRDCVFPNSHYLRNRGGKYLWGNELEQALLGAPPQTHLLQGHLTVREARRLAPNAKLITVLRNPVDRVESLLKHMRARQGVKDSYHSMIADGGVACAAAYNQQTRLLSALDPKAPISEHLASAKEQLDSCLIVGITERYSETLRLCAQALKLDHTEYKYLNKSELASDQFSDDVVDRIEELNRCDLELYDHALTLHERKWASNRN